MAQLNCRCLGAEHIQLPVFRSEADPGGMRKMHPPTSLFMSCFQMKQNFVRKMNFAKVHVQKECASTIVIKNTSI